MGALISEQEDRKFDAIERTCSALSLLGCIFIISTFSLSRSFRKPITRLVFYASFGNMMANVATMMARSFVNSPSSAGCQTQAFLIQMFVPADAFWTLAMASNVYLTFYRKYDAQKLQKMEIPYLILCYGVPFVVALTYAFVQTPERGKMYGNALIWCWISSEWDLWRILTMYGPVWIIIFITIFIYIRTGREIYHKYKTLKTLKTGNHEQEPVVITEPFSTKTTEVYVTSEIIAATVSHGGGQAWIEPPPAAAYSVTITSEAGPRSRPQDSHNRAYEHDQDDEGEGPDEIKITPAPSKTDAPSSSPTSTAPSGHALQRTTTVLSARRVRRARRRLAVHEANSAAWSYASCALLFFTALLVTWIPSTANRAYTAAGGGGRVSLGLEYASAFVLPLQGFWNALIYVFTTRRACGRLLARVGDAVLGAAPGGTGTAAGGGGDAGDAAGGGWRRGRSRENFMMGRVPGGRKSDLGLLYESDEVI